MRHHGFTLLETICTVTILAIILATLAPRTTTLMDGIAVRSATGDAASMLALARQIAVARATRTTLNIDTTTATITITAATTTDTIRHRDAASLFHVSLHSTRPSVIYTPLGIALGGSNLTLVATRGHAADTLTISRLGRVRR